MHKANIKTTEAINRQQHNRQQGTSVFRFSLNGVKARISMETADLSNSTDHMDSHTWKSLSGGRGIHVPFPKSTEKVSGIGQKVSPDEFEKSGIM